MTSAVGKILESRLLSRYRNAPDIKKIGNSYFETLGGLSRETYFAMGKAFRDSIDELFRPLPNPANMMKNLLNVSWEGGARVLANQSGQEYFYGLIRLFDGTEALAHVDHIEWDDRNAVAPLAQLAFNTYLDVPPTGGELVVWDKVLRHEEHEAHARDYGVDETYLQGCDQAIVKPERGDLLVFDARRVHAVRRAHGARLTSSFFAILTSIDGPFFVYS
jgi:hypothetical protein